jgi:hypothetical protein
LTNANFISCHDWLEQLSKPIGDLSPSERLELEAHLTSCPICSVIQLDYKMISNLIRSLPAPDFPPGLPPRLQQMLREEHESEDNATISSVLLDVDNSTMRDCNYAILSREENAISLSPAYHSLVGAKSQNTAANESLDTISCRQSTRTHLSLLRRARTYFSGQHNPLRWLVALTIGPVVNVYCEIYRRMGIKVYFDHLFVCRSCKRIFLFTAEEQRFYQQQNMTNQSGRCPSCRAPRRALLNDMPASSQETQTFHNEMLHS